MAKKIGKLATRYAKALLSLIEKEGGASLQEKREELEVSVKQVSKELVEFAKVWDSNLELRSSIQNPFFPASQRREALRSVSKTLGYCSNLDHFLGFVFDRDRISAISEIAQAFTILIDDLFRVVEVSVTTARTVEADERIEIEKTLSAKISGSPRYLFSVNPEIIGGVVVSYLGRIIDASLSGRLERIERTLAL